jgi:hypothetical protein
MDYYLNYNNCLDRLYKEYKKYGKLIIAYDFDDTIYDFHKKDRNYNDVINLLRQWKDKATFICFTASKPERYKEIWSYIINNNIPCDYVNEGVEGMPNGRKVYYNILLDDRAGLLTAYNLLTDVLIMEKAESIKEYQANNNNIQLLFGKTTDNKYYIRPINWAGEWYGNELHAGRSLVIVDTQKELNRIMEFVKEA